VGGDNAKVTTLPITVDVTDAKTILQLPLFRVTGKDGKDRFVDENGRLYQDMADWRANNQLPSGRVSYFANGHINDAKDSKPNIITENSHAVIDTPGERIKSVADTVLPWLGFAAGAVLIATGLGAPIGAGLITAATVTMAGVGAYGLSQGIGNYNDRASHGQSTTDLSDAEVRGMWLGMTADALSMFAVGSALRLGKGGLSVVDDVGRVGKALSIGAQYADTAAIADTTVTLAQNWDRLTPQQQLASIGQLGFWGVSTAVSARQAGGIENLYGAKSIRETFGGGRESKANSTDDQASKMMPLTEAEQRMVVGGNKEPATTGYERTYPSATDKPRGLNMTLEEVRQRYGKNGVTTVERTEQRAQEIIDHHAAEIARKKGQGNVPNPGPVLSGITDPVTGQTYFGQNFKRGELKNEVFANFQDQLHPILKQRLKNHNQELTENNVKVENLASIDIAGQPGGHSEIRALDAAIKAREQYTGKSITEADLGSFLLHNRSLKNSVDVPPRCVHCWHLTDGVTVIGND
jgi:hypothetical protein